jgi:hypothetical protein
MAYDLLDAGRGALEVRGPNGSVRMRESADHSWFVFHQDGGPFPSRDAALECARKIVGDLPR